MSQKPRVRLCALCGRHPIDDAYRPFCSRRCADVDLQRWFTGSYAIPAEEADSAGADPSSEDDR